MFFNIKFTNNNKLGKLVKIKTFCLKQENKYKNRTIYGIIASKIDKKIDSTYKFKNINFKRNIDYNLIKLNPQFRIINNHELRIATRNEIIKPRGNIKIYKGMEKLKKIKVLHTFLTATLFRNTVCFSGIVFSNYNMSIGAFSNKTAVFLDCAFLSAMALGNYINRLYLYSSFNKKLKEQFGDLYVDLESMYQEIINRFCVLAYELNINDPISLMVLYGTLNHYGCLSVGHVFNDDMSYYENADNDMDVLLFKFGYDIILGQGVCRHHSTFFRDACLRMGFDAKVLALKNLYGDKHAIVGVKYNDDYLYIDPYNEILFRYKEDGKSLVTLDNNTEIELVNVGLREKYMMKKIGFYGFNESDKTSITLEKFLKIYIDVYSNLYTPDANGYIERFYSENKDLYYKFSQKCNEYFEKTKSIKNGKEKMI